jgi:hypothetical protein
MMVRSGVALMSRNGKEEAYGGRLGKELGRSEELKVADEDRGAWTDKWRGLFLGRAIFLAE